MQQTISPTSGFTLTGIEFRSFSEFLEVCEKLRIQASLLSSFTGKPILWRIDFSLIRMKDGLYYGVQICGYEKTIDRFHIGDTSYVGDNGVSFSDNLRMRNYIISCTRCFSMSLDPFYSKSEVKTKVGDIIIMENEEEVRFSYKDVYCLLFYKEEKVFVELGKWKRNISEFVNQFWKPGVPTPFGFESNDFIHYHLSLDSEYSKKGGPPAYHSTISRKQITGRGKKS